MGHDHGDDAGTPTNVFVPKFIVVDLKQAVDVTQFAVDPAATCGDGGSASTGAYPIEASPAARPGRRRPPARSRWTTAAGSTRSRRPRVRAGVHFVRFTIKGNQTPDFATSCPDGAFSGCSFSDLTELEVYGAGN